METISNLIEKTKETIGLAEPHEEAKPLQQQDDQKINDEQDLDSGHTVLETVKDTIMSVVEKTKEMLPFGSSGDQQNQEEDSQSKDDIQQKAMDLKDSAQQKASDVKENIQQKFSDLKESAQQKTSDMKQTIEKKVGDFNADNTGEKRPHQQHQQGEERITQKMQNWNASLQKIEEQHHQPLTKAHEAHESKHQQFDFEKSYGDDAEMTEESSSTSSSTTTASTTTEGIQQKIIDLKDATAEKLTQAKDVVMQKGAEWKETLSNAQTQVFNKLQGEGEEVKKDVSEGAEEQHTGLVAAVSGALHSAFDAGKGLIEKAKDSISDLTTGTTNTDGQEPIDNNKNSESGVASSMKNTASMIGDKVGQWSESAAAKMEQWTENTLGDVSVVDSSEKNKQHMAQPGQPKEMGASNVQPVSKPSESAA